MQDPFIERLRHLYETGRGELYMYALSITKHPQRAEDAVHTAFQAVLRTRRAPRDLRPYVFRSVRNAALDQLKANSREQPLPEFFERIGAPDPTLPALIEDLLQHLSSDHREAVVLKTFSGLTLREIAESRGVSINTAASWYRRGLDHLRQLMEEVPNGPNRKATQ